MASILNLLSCTNPNLIKSEALVIKEVWIYDYFEPIGHTVGSAYRQFEEFEKNNIPQIKLFPHDVDSLENIISISKIKDNFIGKLGQNILFASVITNDDKTRKLAIFSNMIIDYTEKETSYRYYFIKDKEHQELLSNFRNKVINHYLKKNIMEN